MRSLVRLLLLVAAFAYGAMPVTGMSAMAMPMAHVMDVTDDPGEPVLASTVMADIDCPHAGSSMTVADGDNGSHKPAKPMKMTGHCAACLTLAAQPAFSDPGKPARAAEAALAMPQFVSQLLAPQTPPPRA